MEIEQNWTKIKINDLRLNPRNARTHSKKQLRQIEHSIQRFGFVVPIVIDNGDTVLAGHGRIEAARHLGMTEVPCVRLSHMTAADKKAYAIADNKIALNAGWDEEILALELQDLRELDPAFDLEDTGFSSTEIDTLMEGLLFEEQGDPREDRFPPASVERRAKHGDVFQLGSHRLVCGDARDPEVVSAVMDGELAEMVFTDPPYNVPVAGHVGGSGAVKHREFAMASGEMSVAQFIQFLCQAFLMMASHSRDGSIHFICMDWRHLREVQAAAEGIYSELKNLIVWVKDNGGMGTFYRSRHEMIFAFKSGTAPHRNTFELGQHGRYRTNVWEYRGVNTWKKDRMAELESHPTVKPVQMIADAIKDVSRRGSIVLDLFGGSGSTLIAAHKTGRRGYLVELDPVFCDRIIKRWEDYAKDEAVLVAQGVGQMAVASEVAK